MRNMLIQKAKGYRKGCSYAYVLATITIVGAFIVSGIFIWQLFFTSHHNGGQENGTPLAQSQRIRNSVVVQPPAAQSSDDGQFDRLLATLTVLITIFGIVMPAGAYLLQRQSLKEERLRMYKEYKEMVNNQKGLRQKVRGLESKMGKIQTKATQVESKMGEIQTEATQVESKMGEIQTKVTQVESKMGEIQTEVTQVKTELSLQTGKYLYYFAHNFSRRLSTVKELTKDSNPDGTSEKPCHMEEILFSCDIFEYCCRAIIAFDDYIKLAGATQTNKAKEHIGKCFKMLFTIGSDALREGMSYELPSVVEWCDKLIAILGDRARYPESAPWISELERFKQELQPTTGGADGNASCQTTKNA